MAQLISSQMPSFRLHQGYNKVSSTFMVFSNKAVVVRSNVYRKIRGGRMVIDLSQDVKGRYE